MNKAQTFLLENSKAYKQTGASGMWTICLLNMFGQDVYVVKDLDLAFPCI